MEALLTGRTLGKYHIRELIGRGGMAAVYQAYDTTLERTVAVKVLASHLAWEEGWIERFTREARTVAHLRHPNIVTILDVGEHDGIHYIVMDYLDGQTLSGLIRTRGALPLPEVVNVTNQIAAALDYAHSQGVIHRDVKPSNIFVSRRDHVTLTDFGIARVGEGSRLTKTGTMMGTPEYMAPEQITGGAIGAATDLYALGIVCYEMLCGRVPFAGTTPVVMHSQVYAEPPRLSQLGARVPGRVEAVLQKALAKQPEKRFRSATEFARALTVAGPVPALASPHAETPTVAVTLPRKTPLPARSPSTAVVIGGIGTVMVVLAVVSLILFGWRQPGNVALAMATPTLASIAINMPIATMTMTPTAAPTTSITDASVPTATLTPVIPLSSATQTATRTSSAVTPTIRQMRLDSTVQMDNEATLSFKNVAVFKSVIATDLASGLQTQIFPPNDRVRSAAWSPDGKSVLISNYTKYWVGFCSGDSALIRVDADGSNEAKIAEIDGLNIQPSPSHGDKCLYVSGGFQDAIWSPDGQKIAVFRRYNEQGDQCPFILNDDGTGLRMLGACESNDRPRFWSVDGKWIIVVGESPQAGFNALAVDGRQRVPLEKLGQIEMYDERYFPWRVIDKPNCTVPKDWDPFVGIFWYCE